jgi:signal transduction histidine kinase
LIGNAVKFTRGRTPARIEIGVLPKNDGNEEVVFYVKDNGAGFEQDSAKLLFKAFHRLHSEREYEGTGIGLANVQRIIHKHGGKVWAEGELDNGATFYFSLPRSKMHQESLTE